MIWMNLVLTFMEFLTISYCQYTFLAHNERTIFLKKPWYVLMLLADYGMLVFCGLFGDTRIANLAYLVVFFGPVIMGRIGFHKKWKPLVFDLLYGVFLNTAIMGGILFSAWVSAEMKLNSVLLTGNIALFCKVLLMLFGTRLLIFFMDGRLKGSLSKKQLWAILILPCFSLFYVFSLTAMNQVYVQLYGLGLLVANLVAVLAMNLYFFYLIRYQFQAQRLEQEILMFQKENELRYRYYEELDQKYRESRKVIHDMKNHLQAVEELYRDQDVEAGEQYVKDLYHLLNVLGEQHYTQNKMLNIILNEKLRTARNKGIAVTVEIGDVDLMDLKEIDITTIFANLLDNAIEAAEASGEGSFLSIKLDEVRDFRVAELTNSRNPQRKKAGSGHMGLGLENVRNTLNKYHGSMKVEETESEYRVRFMLPGKEKV